MKKPAALLVAAVFLAVLAAQPKNTIVLKAKDYGYIYHIEYVPKPQYTHRALTCSEVAKELLLKSFYGEELDQGLLSFVLKCRKKGFFSETPLSEEFSAEARAESRSKHKPPLRKTENRRRVPGSLLLSQNTRGARLPHASPQRL